LIENRGSPGDFLMALKEAIERVLAEYPRRKATTILGVFGDAARERLRHAKETVWLVDSSAQIAAAAVGSAANAVSRNRGGSGTLDCPTLPTQVTRKATEGSTAQTKSALEAQEAQEEAIE
jgi:hypothetical protein